MIKESGESFHVKTITNPSKTKEPLKTTISFTVKGGPMTTVFTLKNILIYQTFSNLRKESYLNGD